MTLHPFLESLPEPCKKCDSETQATPNVADATFVHLAQRESLSTVVTIDHDDFETYRVGGRKRLNILPSRSCSRIGNTTDRQGYEPVLRA